MQTTSPSQVVEHEQGLPKTSTQSTQVVETLSRMDSRSWYLNSMSSTALYVLTAVLSLVARGIAQLVPLSSGAEEVAKKGIDTPKEVGREQGT
jgi:hypothetical protein